MFCGDVKLKNGFLKNYRMLAPRNMLGMLVD